MERPSLVSRFRSNRNVGDDDDHYFSSFQSNTTYRSEVLGGIGAAPPAQKPQQTGFFSSWTSGHNYGSKSFRLPPSQPVADRYTPMPLRQPSFPPHRQFSRGQGIPFPKAPSDSSLSEMATPNPARIPSSSSVPTGLEAPRMLFSPLTRELRHKPATTGVRPYGPLGHLQNVEQTRQRTVSAPQARSRYTYGKEPEKRWAVQTMCDLIAFPRPHITPHEITPPGSPEREKQSFVVIGSRPQDREQEREEWEAYARKSRGRSLSFGSGSVYRRDRSESMSRRPSQSSQGRSRSGSLGSIFNFVRRPSLGRRSQSDDGQGRLSHGSLPPIPPSRNPSLQRHRGHRASKSMSDVSFGHAAPPPPRPAPLRTLRIAPPPGRPGGVVVIGRDPKPPRPKPLDLSKPLPPLPRSSGPQLPPTTTLPSLSHEIGLAITSEQPASSSPIPALANMPSTPRSREEDSSAEAAHARAYLAKQHQRAMKKRAFQSPAMGRPRVSSHFPGPAAVAASQQPPLSAYSVNSVYSTASTQSSNGGAPSPRRLTALEEAIGRSRSASLGSAVKPASTISSSVRSRPGTAGEERQTGAPALPAPPTISPPSPFSVPAPFPSPPLPHPISSAFDRQLLPANPFNFPSQPTKSVQTPAEPSQDSLLQVIRPEMVHSDTATSKASGMTVYTDASEGWSRASETPATPTPSRGIAGSAPEESPGDQPTPQQSMDESDFRGLFFRTPHDRQGSFSSTATPAMGPSSSVSNGRSRTGVMFPAPVEREEAVGLGYDLPTTRNEVCLNDEESAIQTESRRGSEQSAQSGDSTASRAETTVIATPTLMPFSTSDARLQSPTRAFGGYVGPIGMGSANPSEQDLSPRQMLSLGSEGQLPSPPITGHNSEDGGSSRPVSEEIRVSSVVSRRPTMTATPGHVKHRRSQEISVDQSGTPPPPPTAPKFIPSPTLPSPTSPNTTSLSPVPGYEHRDSTAVSFMNDFPSPPSSVRPGFSHAEPLGSPLPLPSRLS